ncbi:hypothetical protein ACTFIZ_008727 [Dictyostelium cf. discoideum]
MHNQSVQPTITINLWHLVPVVYSLFEGKKETGLLYRTNRERINKVKEESDNLLIQDELKGTQILIFENKQDMNNIMNTTDIVKSLNLNSIKDRKSYIQPCSAIKSNGIYEGFNWITNSLNINK